MASPAPDTPVPDVKPRDPVPEKESKPEVNGHTTPAETPTETEAPKVNGAVKAEEQPATNGVSKDVQMENGTDEKPDAEIKAENKTPVSEKPQQPVSGDDSKPKTEEPVKEDVDMVDAEPAVDGAEKESAKPAETATEPEKDDVDTKMKQDVDSSQLEDVDAGKKEVADSGKKENVDSGKKEDVDSGKKEDVEPTKKEDVDNTEKADSKAVLGSTEKADADTAKDGVNGTGEAVPAPTEEKASTTAEAEVDLQPASLSQLAIESSETEVPASNPSVEITMEDAPADTSSTKVAREREDDAAEEPAPKRARTEPKEDEPSTSDTITATVGASASAAGTPSQSEGIPFLHRLSNWNDTELPARPITAYQRREIRKVLSRVKKTKHGAHFRDSVQKLWPALWDSYVAKIDKPTDLAEIDRHVRDSATYPTWGHLKDEVKLMYDNTLAYNGPTHDVTTAARGAIKSLWEDVVRIPAEEPVKPKPLPKQKPPPREHRAPPPVEVRKPTAAPATTTITAAERVKSSTPNREPSTEAVRKGSLTSDLDRPKRSVRPPKPKDIDYTKPSRKKLKPELQFAEEVLAELMHSRNKHINSWFMEPVDAEGLNIPQYYSVIKKPMDLGKVANMLSAGEISSLKDFDKNVRLIFTNCYTFNGSVDQGNAVSYVAKQLEDYYVGQMKGKDAWLAKHAKANAPPPSDDDEEEDEGEEQPAPAVDVSKEVRELEAKLREESGKLNDLFAADSPNSSLITVQQGILKMVQEALLKAKTSANEARAKQDKPSKKASKPAKPKGASGPSRKQAGGSAQPKKASGGKKASKKSLTAADKDAIANAINDLEFSDLDRAIDIIKRDTGQAENNDGELELDIDQLSNEALLKLWELCKKVLPGFGKDSAPAPPPPEVSRSQPAKSSGTKPKKNKPMSAKEQEERIAQLRGLRDLYKPGQDGPDGPGLGQDTSPAAESSDDSDSEEE